MALFLSVSAPPPYVDCGSRLMESAMATSRDGKMLRVGRPYERGFTLLELLVVLVILGLFATIAAYEAVPPRI